MVTETEEETHQVTETEEASPDIAKEELASTETKEHLMQISIQAVQGVTKVTTYTLLVSMGGKKVVALLDSGSSHTFMDLRFAINASCKIMNNSL